MHRHMYTHTCLDTCTHTQDSKQLLHLHKKFLQPLNPNRQFHTQTCPVHQKPTCGHTHSFTCTPHHTHTNMCNNNLMDTDRIQCSPAPTDSHVRAHPQGRTQGSQPLHTHPCRARAPPQPRACSLVDEPVTDLAGQEDVWMQPQGLLVQQAAQRAVQVAQAEVGAEGHQGLGGVGRHAGGQQVGHTGTGPPGATVTP